MATTVLEHARTDSSTLMIWGFSTALATLGTATLWGARCGINWGVLIACAVIALCAAARDRFGSVGAPMFAACAWAVVLAFGTAVTSDRASISLIVPMTIALLAVALVTFGQPSLDVLMPRTALLAPFEAIGLVLAGIRTEATGTIRSARSPSSTVVFRSALITIPLVFILVALLAEADPLFAAVRDSFEHIVSADVASQGLLFVPILAVTLGGLATVFRGRPREFSRPAASGAPVGIVERRVLLSTLATIMWVFVTSASVSLMRNPAAISGSGITFAEYVHRGFAELSISATLVIGVVLVTRASWVKTDAWARRFAFAAITGEVGMIAVGFMRVVSYEQAYGFTTQRLYAQAYTIVLAGMSALLLSEIVRRRQSRRYAFYSANIALTVFATCVYWNTDAWIARQNIDRYTRAGTLDEFYLTFALSEDAIPEIMAAIPRLAPKERATMTTALCRASVDRSPRDARWFTWNYRALQADRVYREWYAREQPNCQAKG